MGSRTEPHERGATTTDPPRDISQVMSHVLELEPERSALITPSGSFSYLQLDAAANRAAQALQSLGVSPGDRIGVSLANDFDIVAAFHGTMRLGAIWVGLNRALAGPEKAYILNHSEARVVIADAAGARELCTRRDELPYLRVIASADEPVPGCLHWPMIVAAQEANLPARRVDPRAAAAIAYTSGTTGHPKGAVHSQLNLLLPGHYLGITRGYGPALRKGDCFPLTIVNMMVLTTLLTSQAGGTALITDDLSARGLAGWIRGERIGVWNGPPPILYTMAHDPGIEPIELAGLTEVWSGGADCPERIRRAFEAKFQTRIYSTYGLTEAPTVVAIEPLDEAHITGSSGRPLPHLSVTARNPDGSEAPGGEVGEICVQASTDRTGPPYEAMLEYWNNPQATAETVIDRVLHTGDAGRIDADGNLIVSDRLNLMLNRGGANVYPAEIERVVLGLGSVEACGVIGVPDPRLGQRVGLLVQFKPGAAEDLDEVLARCRTELAAYKVPELAAAVADLPRNAMGKLDRRALAALGASRLVRAGAL